MKRGWPILMAVSLVVILMQNTPSKLFAIHLCHGCVSASMSCHVFAQLALEAQLVTTV